MSPLRLMEMRMLFMPVRFGLLGASLATLAVAAAPLEKRVLLLAGSNDSFTARGLTALGVPFERRSPADYARSSPFRHDLIIWGLDESRAELARDPESVAAFLAAGGVLLCFRSSDEEAWLPSPLRRDKAYQFGRILSPEHAVFTTPHRLGEADLRAVHGGSIYRAFLSPGTGWVPLLSGGAPQDWDKTPEAASGQEHFGLLELPLGSGRLIMLQMIPEYHWFNDCKGDRASAGARFFENLITYALACATPQAASRLEPALPAAFVQDLDTFMVKPCGFAPDRPPALDWTVTAKGPYQAAPDRRGIWTVSHADVPSILGNACELTREFRRPAERGNTTLSWYYSDTYCGGTERILGGADHGKAAFANERKAYRFAQVLVNGLLVWEQDTHGRNPQPASRRFYNVDIAAALKAKEGDTYRVTLRVEDRLGSADKPFAVDVFWGAIGLLEGVARVTATQLSGQTVLALAPGQSVSWQPDRRAGQARLAVRLQDRPQDRPELVLSVAGSPRQRWLLSADDQGWYWAVSEPLDLPANPSLSLALEGAAGSVCPLRELALIPLSVTAAPPALAAPVPLAVPHRVALTVPESAGLARTAEVATQGIPFAPGALPAAAALSCTDQAGTAVPCQAAPLVLWPDGSVKVALVSVPVTVEANRRAVYHLDQAPGQTPPTGQLTVREQGDELVIDTGVISATVSRTHGRLVESVRRHDGRELKRADQVWDLALEDETGRVVRSGGPTVTALEFADRGPLRLLLVRKGSLADAAGNWIDYRLQLEATAGSEALRCETLIVNREAGAGVFLRRWSMNLAGLATAPGRVWLGNDESAPLSPGAVLYQHREDRLTWTGKQGAREWATGSSPGFLRSGGIAFGPRWFWQRFPQCLRFEETGLRYDLITAPYDERDLPRRWQQRLAETTDRYEVGGVGYPQSPGKMGLFRLAAGEALHQEVLFAFDGATDTAEVRPALAPLLARLRAVPDPAYTSSTAVFGEFQPADGLFGHYETSVEAAYKGYLAKRLSRREYGFENYGDDTFEWGYGPSYTYWSNSEYDHHHAFLLQYLRSGDPRWWEVAEEQSRQYRDVVIVHAGTAEIKGGPRHHNATALWMPQHEEQFWVADHTASGASCGHSWAEGMVEYWLLTGDPWSGEVVRDLADWYCNRVENNDFGAGGQERGPGWALIAISGLTATLRTERLLRVGSTVAEWIETWQDPLRGVISVAISEQPSYEGGSVFMHGIVGRALGRWAEVSGDPRARLACIGIAEWLTTEPMGARGTFWYKQSPQNSRSYSPDGQCLTALTYAQRFSGDPWFGEVALALYRQTGASTRSMSWYPQALAHLAPLITPAEVILEAESVTVAPGAPRTLDLRVRNTSAKPVRAAVRAQAPAPFTLESGAPVMIAAGETRALAASLGTRLPTGRARLPVTVDLTLADGTTKTAVVSVEARAMDRLVELWLAAEQAAVTPPMVRETLDGKPCLHTPRTPQTVLKPRPQDPPEGGLAQFEFELPVAGRYAFTAEVWWLDEQGNSLFLSVDGGPDQSFGNAGAMNRWIRLEATLTDLAAGRHTLRLRTREDGARLAGVMIERRPAP
jgi:hypothetical protein